MFTIKVSGEEFDAILAGLRTLQRDIENGQESEAIRDIRTNGGEHQGLTSAGIDSLAERIN